MCSVYTLAASAVVLCLVWWARGGSSMASMIDSRRNKVTMQCYQYSGHRSYATADVTYYYFMFYELEYHFSLICVNNFDPHFTADVNSTTGR